MKRIKWIIKWVKNWKKDKKFKKLVKDINDNVEQAFERLDDYQREIVHHKIQEALNIPKVVGELQEGYKKEDEIKEKARKVVRNLEKTLTYNEFNEVKNILRGK